MKESQSRAAVAAALVVGLLVATVVPVASVAAQNDVQVADGHTGTVDPGRQDNEQQKYPLNYTFFPATRTPGNQNGAAEHYAVGLTEDIRLHWIVVTSKEFDFSSCEAGDTNAFGVDRGNDDPGTKTDVSLLTSYRSYTSTPDQIQIAYYKESALAGEPIRINVEDQIVAKQSNCYDNPKQKGWYRVTGKINGSTKMDATTDYTVVAGTQYIYVCDCQNREEARQKLGPPPNEQGGSSDSTPTATPEATATPTPDSQPTATARETATAAPTATARQQTATATARQQQDQSTATPTPKSSATAAPKGQQRDDTAPRATATDRASVPRTPTLAEGPGFGSVVALLGLVAAGLVAVRQNRRRR